VSFENPLTSWLSTTNTKGIVWIEIQAIPISKLTQNVRAQSAYLDKTDMTKTTETSMAITLKKARWYKFKFLASQELMENLSHTWESYDSIASKLAGVYASLVYSTKEQLRGLLPKANQQNFELKQIPGILGVGKKALSDANKPGGKGAIARVGQFLNDYNKSGYVAQYRVDTPLVYKGSERRSFELIFNLINQDAGGNHQNVVLPVKLLEMLSSPSYNATPDANFNADILLPYLFTIRTWPGDLLVCDLAVLKSVNPTWRGPWIDGYPSRCELRLSFTEYRPLEQRNFYGLDNTANKVITKFQTERSGAVDKISQDKSDAEQKALLDYYGH